MDELDLIIEKKKIKGYQINKEEADLLVKLIVEEGKGNKDLCLFLESLNIHNFSHAEAFILASAIANTGKKIDIASKIGPCVSKDSAGYVSDSVTLIAMSALAALGVKVVKMTNTRYGAFGNTISKLNMIDGFSASVSRSKFTSIAEKVGCAILENKGDIAPADIALKNIMDSFTVVSLPLLAVSLIAKKIALGASVVVYDVKNGEGGLVKSVDDANKLGKYLVETSKLAGIKSACVVTTLNQPISASLGAMAELKEVIRSLSSGTSYFDSDLMTVSKEIVEIALILSGAAEGRSDASEMFDEVILSGAALSKFKEIVLAFGGNFTSLNNNNASILSGVAVSYVEADRAGYLADIDTPGLYESLKLLAAQKEEDFDKNAGIIMLVREGAKVRIGDKIARIMYSFDNPNYPLALAGIRSALCVRSQKPKREKLLVKVYV